MSEKILTKEIAEQFIADEAFEDMLEFTSLDVDAALTLIYHEQSQEEWSEFSFGFYLSGLREVSDDLADVLKTYSGQTHHGEKCSLDLSSVIKISENAIKSLSEFNGDEIILSSLECLSDESCSDLSYYRGSLNLDGIEYLSVDSINSLSRHAGGGLSLNGLLEITDEMADLLACYRGDLSLSGLVKISDGAAESLSKVKGELSLDGLTELSDAAAESLSKCQGYLSLDGLTKLSDTAAESLAKIHSNEITLPCGIEQIVEQYRGLLTKEIAEEFIQNEHSDNLNEFTKIDDAAAESLSKFESNLYLLGLTKLSDAAAESLSKHEGNLWLTGLKIMRGSVAQSLAKMAPDKLHLPEKFEARVAQHR